MTREESHAKTYTTARGRKIHGLTCRTWVHDPLKLLLALRGRLHTFSSERMQKRIACRFCEKPRGSAETGPQGKRAPVENTERVFSGTRDISGIKYVAELLGNLTEKPQEARPESCRLRKRMRMWKSLVSFRRVSKYYFKTQHEALNYFGKVYDLLDYRG